MTRRCQPGDGLGTTRMIMAGKDYLVFWKDAADRIPPI